MVEEQFCDQMVSQLDQGVRPVDVLCRRLFQSYASDSWKLNLLEKGCTIQD